MAERVEDVVRRGCGEQFTVDFVGCLTAQESAPESQAVVNSFLVTRTLSKLP